MIFNPNQIQELIDTVNFHTTLFIADNVSPEMLNNVDETLLKKHGVDIKKYKGELTPVDYAFRFGILSQVLGYKQTKGLSFREAKKFIHSGHFLPLTSYEKSVLDSIKHQSLRDIKNLGSQMTNEIVGLAAPTAWQRREKYEKLIRTEAMEAVKKRETVKDLVSRLGNKTGEWNRNFGRIADYIMHTAFDEGRAAEIIKKEGPLAIVYKDVYPGACKYCIKFYTTKGIGTEPKKFKLQELIDNGSNIGRKVDEWLPVIGSVHPFCRDTLNLWPKDYEWDNKTGGFTKFKEYRGKTEKEVIKQKKENQIKVEVGDKVYYV